MKYAPYRRFVIWLTSANSSDFKKCSCLLTVLIPWIDNQIIYNWGPTDESGCKKNRFSVTSCYFFGCQAVFWTSGDLTELCSQLWISIIMMIKKSENHLRKLFWKKCKLDSSFRPQGVQISVHKGLYYFALWYWGRQYCICVGNWCSSVDIPYC